MGSLSIMNKLTPAQILIAVFSTVVGSIVLLFVALAALVFTGHAVATVLVDDIQRALVILAGIIGSLATASHFTSLMNSATASAGPTTVVVNNQGEKQ